MLFKMLGIERAWAMLGGDGPRPRQLFVTQSRVLAEKVEEYFTKLLQSLAISSCSLQELAEMAKTRKDNQAEEMMVDRDDEINWRGDLPTRFSQLEDKHFPLFVNFDRVSYLLFWFRFETLIFFSCASCWKLTLLHLPNQLLQLIVRSHSRTREFTFPQKLHLETDPLAMDPVAWFPTRLFLNPIGVISHNHS
jgi:hypothetical protein